MSDLDEAALLAAVTHASFEAGRIAMAFFAAGAATTAAIEAKFGGSPVTEADFAVDRFLLGALAALLPGAGWLSEETADTDDRLTRARVFVVDPIDGTRAFIKGDPRWAVSIALVEEGRPRLAVLHLPSLDLTFAALKGKGATLNGAPIRVSARPQLAGGLLAGPPKRLEELRSAGLDIEIAPRVPSLAYRIAMVASGELDAGLASGNAADWDLAAADLILVEAGGRLIALDGAAPLYNEADPHHGPLVAAPPQLAEDLRRRLLQSSNGGKPAARA
jgi:myo-inositol-1(or 4)-monophosphatase